MAKYEVTCRGDAREVYYVEAESAAEAMRLWYTGELLVSEVSSAEPVEARLCDD